MTIVIYKNNVLATDSRISNTAIADHRCRGCPECNAIVDRLVADDKCKINLIDKEKEYFFRNDRILAYAGAGEVATIDAFKNIIDQGMDIEETFKSFSMLHVGSGRPNMSMLLVGVLSVWGIYIEKRDKLELRVKQTTREGKPLIIGSGYNGYEWVNHLTGGVLSPPDMISIIKTREKTVGGDIHYIDFNNIDPVIQTLDESTVKFTLERFRSMTKTIIE